ncbi:MAG: O-antigen ligase family protein [Vicinamibacterales bacterium]
MQRALLLSLVSASYLLLAGGPRWTLAPLLGVALLCVAWAPRRTLAFPASTRSLDTALLALAAGIAIQVVPLPARVVALVSPHAQPLRAALRFTVGRPSGEAWLPLSIDAEATAYALAATFLGILSFWIARATFSAGGHTRQFCRALGLLAAIAAMVAIVQKAVMPGLVMGVITPEARNASPMGPFLNRNHFGAWLLMVSTASLGYITAHLHIHPAYRQRMGAAVKRFVTSGALLSGIAAIVTIGALLMTLSRSAVAGLGAAALFAGWLARPRLRVERTALPALYVTTGLVLLLLVLFIDIEGWLTRVQHSLGLVTGFDRLTIWRESLPMVRDFIVTGTGAGTYGQAMGEYQQSRFWVGSMQRWAHFNNAHSHYVQLAAEGGLLLVVPAVAALTALARLGVAAVRADKGEVFWVRAGAAAGLVGIAVQSIWEVPLVMPANAVLVGVLAGLLLHRRDAVRSQTPPELGWAPDHTPTTAGRNQ